MATKISTKERPPRKDVLYLKIDQIEVEEGFNVRIDYGNIDELAASIKENGVKIPLRGFKKGDNYILTDGHRRFRAAEIIHKNMPEMRVPFIVDKTGRNLEQRVIDLIICNDGKHLNPLEEAEAVSRLINMGMTEKDVAKKTGKTGVYISNLKLLQDAPQKIKNMIMDDVVSATFAMKILRETEDFQDAVEKLSHASEYAEKQGKRSVTQKDYDKAHNKVNSYSEMRKLFKKSKERIVRDGKENEYALANKILNGEMTREQLDEYFFEPVADEEDHE